ncbi:MAG TPA: hypothetical protein VG754_11195, partial [Verrucomicrobiae bacterium]|nr:hypothetical protein [Verrucomicrobiae bacterium]
MSNVFASMIFGSPAVGERTREPSWQAHPRTTPDLLAMPGGNGRTIETERGSMSRSNARRTGHVRLIHAHLSFP